MANNGNNARSRVVEIYFEIPPSETLNSNSQPKSTFLKSKMVSHIRGLAREIGVNLHPNEKVSKATLRNSLEKERVKAERSRIKKALNKAGESEEGIAEALARISPVLEDVVSEYVFNRYKVSVWVYGSTRSVLDPPNYYPTIKAFIDGLTDVGFWEDDNYRYQDSMTFFYGGKCSTPKRNGFRVVLEEVSEPFEADSIQEYSKTSSIYYK